MSSPCTFLGPPKRAIYTHVLPVIGTVLPEIPFSRNRSKRLWKKLHKRGAKPLYGRPMIMPISLDVIEALRRMAR